MKTSRIALLVLPLALSVAPACGGATNDDLAGTAANQGGNAGSAQSGAAGVSAGAGTGAGGNSGGSGPVGGSSQAGSGQSGSSTAGKSGSGGNSPGGNGPGGSSPGGNGPGGNGPGGSGPAGNGPGGSGPGGSGPGGGGPGGGGPGGSGPAGNGPGGGGPGGGEPGGGGPGGGEPGGGEPGGSGPGGGGPGGNGPGGGEPGGSGPGGSGGAPDCEGPEDPTKSALCVKLLPEAMDFLSDDPKLDGQGVVYLAVFDTPFPDGKNGMPKAQALAASLWPPQGMSGVEGALVDVPVLRLTNLPPTVYVRAFFFDNADALLEQQVSWGVWLGGTDFSQGAQDNTPLQKVDLVAGQSQGMTLPLTALRKLTVTLSVAPGVKPLDDAQGPLQWAAFKEKFPKMQEPVFGVGGPRCSDLAGGQKVDMTGFFFGSGKLWIAATLDDFNLGSSQPGSLFTADFSSGVFALPDSSLLDVPPQSYRETIDVPLNIVIPLNGPTPPSYQCP